MTDPTAALADNWLDNILLRYANRIFGQAEGIECRDAILAALRPGWCGHVGNAPPVIVNLGPDATRDELNTVRAQLDELYGAEITRLRAALEIIAAPPTDAIDAIGVSARNIARHALRAALEAAAPAARGW